MRNFEYVTTMPEGYDGRTKIAITKQGVLVIAHPELPVRYFDGKHWLEPLSAPAFESFEGDSA